MIRYDDIKAGILAAIQREFDGYDVSDNPYDKLEGPAFVVKCIGSTHTRFSTEHANRVYNFDCVFFAPMDMPMYEIDSIGQRFAEAFIFPLHIGKRYIQPTNIQTNKVDKDFHVTFDLTFYDKLPQREYEFMKELNINFRLELG